MYVYLRRTRLLRQAFPVQRAEMLRLACCLGTENGIRICAPIHDAVLITAMVQIYERQQARERIWADH